MTQEGPGAAPPLEKKSGIVRFLLLFHDLLKPRNIAMLVGLAAIGIVALTGGLGEVATADQDLPTTTPSATATAPPLEVVVRKAYWTTKSVTGLFPAQDGIRHLMVSIELTNTGDQPIPVYTVAESFRIDAGGLVENGTVVDSAAADPVVTRSNDLADAGAAQPGLITPLVLVWQQKTTQAVPTSFLVTIRGHVWRASALDGSMQWLDASDEYRVSIPVVELPV